MRVALISLMILIGSNYLFSQEIEIYNQAFVLYENQTSNLIVIPNLGKYHTFKFFRKNKEDSEYELVTIKKKPPLPMRYRMTPYEVKWEDTGVHSREVEYQIIAFKKNGEEICTMKIIWDEEIESTDRQHQVNVICNGTTFAMRTVTIKRT